MNQRPSLLRDPRLLLLVPLILVVMVSYRALVTRGGVTPEQQQQLAAAQLRHDDLPADHPSQLDATRTDELSAVDRALLEKRIQKVHADGTPAHELWTPFSAAIGVGGGILFLGGIATLMIWRQTRRQT